MKLNNNSKEMKTIVETFVIEETQELIYDDAKLNKWNNLVDKLELSGQKEIVKPTKSPIPFMHIKSGLRDVFSTLCPVKVNIKDYNLTPIPVEILSLVSLSISENYFSEIQIWYDDKKPDPACIGIQKSYYLKKKGSWDVHSDNSKFITKELAVQYVKDNELIADIQEDYSNVKYYLLGKWADVKHSFDELKQMAIKRYIEKETIELNKTILDANRRLEDLKFESYNKFN